MYRYKRYVSGCTTSPYIHSIREVLLHVCATIWFHIYLLFFRLFILQFKMNEKKNRRGFFFFVLVSESVIMLILIGIFIFISYDRGGGQRQRKVLNQEKQKRLNQCLNFDFVVFIFLVFILSSSSEAASDQKQRTQIFPINLHIIHNIHRYRYN